MDQIPREAARRLLLQSQGLGGGARELFATIEQLGYVQLDSINVVGRAHELILHSRLPSYRHEGWHELLRSGQVFEHWTHDAAIIPSAFLPHWLTRFQRDGRRIQANRWWRERLGERAEAVMESVKAELRRRGPLMAKDFPSAGDKRPGEPPGWWNWKPEKAALEYLWRTGQVVVVERRNFHKVYQLAEVHLPALAQMKAPRRAETVDWACRQALARLALATPSQLVGFWGQGLVSLAEARKWTSQPPKGVVAVLDPGGRAAVARADWREAAEAAAPGRTLRLLAPFDPIVRDRARAQLLFDFDFRFEAFVPAAKRLYGYYTLPILDGDKLAGRVTPKLDRRQSRLDILRVDWEPGVQLTRARQARLDEALQRLAAFLGAERIGFP